MTRRMTRIRVAFKATSSKGKAKQESSSEDEDLSFKEMDYEKMTLFVKRFGKFMMKKGYHARRKKSSSKNKEESRMCFNCGSKDHLVAQCPHNSGNDDDNKKSKKDKKEKKEKKDKMTFKKKRVVHMWSLGIVMLPQVMMMIVMMTRPPRRRHL